MQEQTWGKNHCTSCCWYSVWLRGAAGLGGVGGAGGEANGETIQTYPYSHCTFHHQNSQRVQTSFTLPTNLGKALANITHCTCFLSACLKTGQDPCKNKHGENCIVQVVCWYSVWLPGAAGVGGEVSEETIRTYLYSNCTFLHQI